MAREQVRALGAVCQKQNGLERITSLCNFSEPRFFLIFNRVIKWPLVGAVRLKGSSAG